MIDQTVILIDTCAIIQIAGPLPLQPGAAREVEDASNAGMLRVSPISAWEIAMAISRGRINTPLDPQRFFDTFLQLTGSLVCELSPEVMIKSVDLPGQFHKDPMDRILVATARHHGFKLLTSDRAILAYGERGHVKTLAC